MSYLHALMGGKRAGKGRCSWGSAQEAAERRAEEQTQSRPSESTRVTRGTRATSAALAPSSAAQDGAERLARKRVRQHGLARSEVGGGRHALHWVRAGQGSGLGYLTCTMRAKASQYTEDDTAKSTVLIARPMSPQSSTFLRPKRVHATDSSGDTNSDAAL